MVVKVVLYSVGRGSASKYRGHQGEILFSLPDLEFHVEF
jgi:hypothetical protein